MTASMYLCYVTTPQVGARIVNGVTAVLVNSVSSTDALLNAALACNAYYNPTNSNAVNNTNDSDDSEADFYQGNDAFGTKYFGSYVVVSSSGGVPASGNGSADGDAYIFEGPAAIPKFVLGTAYTPVG